jgi:hypothetical protein
MARLRPGDNLAGSLADADLRVAGLRPTPSCSPWFLHRPTRSSITSVVALATLVALIGFHAALERFGYRLWPSPMPAGGDGELRLPTVHHSWPLVIGAALLVAAALTVSVSLFG